MKYISENAGKEKELEQIFSQEEKSNLTQISRTKEKDSED